MFALFAIIQDTLSQDSSHLVNVPVRRPQYMPMGELGYAPVHSYHDYAQYNDNRGLIADVQCRLLHCVYAIDMMEFIEKALFDNTVLSNSCLSLQLLEKNLYDMAVENLTEGVFYALTLSHKGMLM